MDLFNTLLVHVNIIPQSLAIAQASLESGWGTSRFAQEANNLFGVWCYTPNCGLVPQQRLAAATHEVARFDTPQESVRQYMQLLNSHPAYKNLRQTRNTYHEQQLSLHGCILARELKNYSELREEYIDRLLQVIRVNKLERPDLLENECRSEQVVKR